MTMKVLVIAPYRDGTGYGQAAIDNILAMDAVGIDVVPRPIKLNTNVVALPERLLELESKTVRGADFVIQHTLPEMMEYSGHFLANIAMYCSETSNFIASNWPNRLNCMDAAWVPSQQMVDAAKESNVTIPVKRIPYPTNVSKFERNYKKFNLGSKDNFVFYTIAEMGKRKNLKAILQAFHTEFDVNEPVSLVIKTHRHGLSASDCRQGIENDCNTIKEWLKLYPSIDQYKKEIIITEFLSEESIYGLHKTCDCFVLCSYGEAWAVPAFDGMGFGKTPIVTNWGGFKEYITDDTGWLVDSHEEQVLGINDNLPELYTARETWAGVSIGHLRKCMREAYSNQELRSKKASLGIEKAYDFSYEKIGSLIKKELESYEQQQNQRRHNNLS